MAGPEPSRAPLGGGVLIALGLLAGAFGGAAWGEPTIGFLLGGGAGIAAALAIWLRDRGR